MMSKHILIVDDSVSIQQMFALFLTQAGHCVSVAENGEDALTLCQHKQYDLIFTDLTMPDISGIQLTRELRQTATYRGVPIIVVTTDSDEQQKQAGRAAGVTGWVRKPAEPALLVTVVEQLCA